MRRIRARSNKKLAARDHLEVSPRTAPARPRYSQDFPKGAELRLRSHRDNRPRSDQALEKLPRHHLLSLSIRALRRGMRVGWSCPIQSPEILDQLDAAPAPKRQSKSNHPGSMLDKHFPRPWRIVGLRTHRKPVAGVNHAGESNTDERCMMDDEHPRFCEELYRG